MFGKKKPEKEPEFDLASDSYEDLKADEHLTPEDA